MSRLKIEDTQEVKTLDELIPQYAINKNELDSYKKICDDENAKIKAMMLEANEDSHTAGGYVAKRIVVNKESMNEVRLLNVLKKYNIPGVIKTVEAVDMDALENYLYNNEASGDFATELASCKETTQVIQLRVSAEKKKKSED